MIEKEDLIISIENSIRNILNEKLSEPLGLIYNYNMFQQLKINSIQESILFLESLNKKPPMFIKNHEYYKYIFDNYLTDTNNDFLYLEFGVFRGRTINLFSILNPNITFYGFDSFEGFEENWFGSGRRFALNELPKVNSNVKLIKGYFENTLKPFIEYNQKKVKFIHIDSDTYSACYYVLNVLFEQNLIEEDCIVLFDEFYCIPNWKEFEYKAWIEIVKKFDICFEYIAATYNNQIAIRILNK